MITYVSPGGPPGTGLGIPRPASRSAVPSGMRTVALSCWMACPVPPPTKVSAGRASWPFTPVPTPSTPAAWPKHSIRAGTQLPEARPTSQNSATRPGRRLVLRSEQIGFGDYADYLPAHHQHRHSADLVLGQQTSDLLVRGDPVNGHHRRLHHVADPAGPPAMPRSVVSRLRASLRRRGLGALAALGQVLLHPVQRAGHVGAGRPGRAGTRDTRHPGGGAWHRGNHPGVK